MRKALIIGGSGQIGRAAAARLLAEDWSVVSLQRTPDAATQGVAVHRGDRSQSGVVAEAAAGGVDAVIDCIAFDEDHATQLIEIQDDVGAFVVISSASVYRDTGGRTLDEARQTGFPQFPVPLREDQPTVEPGPATYSTRKVALERALGEGLRRPVTILRPGAIHGVGSDHLREWFFIRRILDARTHAPLAWSGESRFHTSAATNIAALIETVLARPTTAILHAADPRALTSAEVCRAVASAMDAHLEPVALDGPPKNGVGGHPWAIPNPIVLDTRAAEALGWRPAGSYEDLVGEACRWGVRHADKGGRFAPYIESLFDYAAEDEWLTRSCGSGRRSAGPGVR